MSDYRWACINTLEFQTSYCTILFYMIFLEEYIYIYIYIYIKVNGQNIYICCSWWYIYYSSFIHLLFYLPTCFDFRIYPAYKSTLLKTFFKYKNTITEHFSYKSSIIICAICFAFTKTSNTWKIYSQLTTPWDGIFLKKATSFSS